ncbi:tetratricopeptide repeat protein [Marinobacter lacisalsi]|uniref:Tetratricopeptide repeat protein n=1 Tax=Marinobacter lacisalsi TaxID=475979 RepID=A0ABV8QHK1_9GAMM
MNRQSSPQNSSKRPRRAPIRWLLFIAFIHTVPAPIYLVLAIGVAPPLAIILFGLHGTFRITEASPAIALMLLLPGLLYAALCLVVAQGLAVLLDRMRGRRARTLLLLALTLLPLWAALQPIYFLAGEGQSERGSVLDAWLGVGLSGAGAAAYGLVLLAVLLFFFACYWRGRLPALWFSLFGYWRRVGVGLAMAALAGLFLVNPDTLICRPFAIAGHAGAQVCLAESIEAKTSPYLGKYPAEHWYELAALDGNETALWKTVNMNRDEAKKRFWLMRLAKEGNGEAQYLLYREMQSDGTSEQESRIWLEKAAGNGQPDAQWRLAAVLRHEFATEAPSGGLEGYRSWLRKAADQGNHQALVTIAQHLSRGSAGFDVDLERAKTYYKRALSTDPMDQTVNYQDRIDEITRWQEGLRYEDVDTLVFLGRQFATAWQARPVVRQKGLELLGRAGALGHEQAYHEASDLLIYGRDGMPRDVQRGQAILREAANDGDIRALEKLYSGYFQGHYGFDRDYRKAREMIDKLIEAYRHDRGFPNRYSIARLERDLDYIQRMADSVGGRIHDETALRDSVKTRDVESTYQLAMQLNKLGGYDDVEEAVSLFHDAADAGHTEAQWELHLIYLRGETVVEYSEQGTSRRTLVNKMPDKAMTYLKQAAAGKHRLAMAHLALYYQKGRHGLPVDYEASADLYRELIQASEDNTYGWDVDLDQYTNYEIYKSHLARSEMLLEITR